LKNNDLQAVRVHENNAIVLHNKMDIFSIGYKFVE